MKKIAVLTYNVKHRKTYDVMMMLKASGYDDVKVFATPLHYEKKFFPIIQHRPGLFPGMPETGKICGNLGYSYEAGEISDFEIEADRVVLIAGAGLIPDSFIQAHRIINVHPGYIPNCRGLDALKWAIVEKQPIGVTAHFLGTEVDAGEVIERRKIDVYLSDTFHALAYRVYENEISLMIEAVRLIDRQNPTVIHAGDYPLHKRMPKEIEQGLLSDFEEYKALYGKKCR